MTNRWESNMLYDLANGIKEYELNDRRASGEALYMPSGHREQYRRMQTSSMSVAPSKRLDSLMTANSM